MKKILLLFAGTLLCLSLANASLIPCASATGSVTVGGTSPMFTCGTLTFDNFELVNPTNGATGRVAKP
jgi:hypothetical protein